MNTVGVLPSLRRESGGVFEMFRSRSVASSKWKPKLLGKDGVFFFFGDRNVFLKQALHDFHWFD